MTPILDNAKLGTDLDCQNFDLHNIRHMYPVPPGLVDSSSDIVDGPLPVLDGSVINDSVADTAGIEQSKLNLDGDIPPEWLQVDVISPEADQAIRGDKAEYLSRKGANNGYAPLTDAGKLPAANVTPGAQPGTVNTVRLLLPPEMEVSGSDTITTSGTFAAVWKGDVPVNSWFGVKGADDLSGHPRPFFHTDPLPVELVPDLGATKFTTGTFALEQLPRAVGMGIDHAVGILPDPGTTGQATDYIGRDMKWHRFAGDKAYQPTLKKPNIILVSWIGTNAKITINSVVGSVFFYRVTSVLDFPFAKAPGTTITFTAQEGDYIEAYSAKAGYNNSEISDYVVLTPFG